MIFEKDSIVDEFTNSVGDEYHLTEEMPFEDIIFEAIEFGYNKVKEEAKIIIQDLLNNSDEYARQRVMDFLRKDDVMFEMKQEVH